MKQAYVSLVAMVRSGVDGIDSDLSRIDEILSNAAQGHEIILVVLDGHGSARGRFEELAAALNGPLVVIFPATGTTIDEAIQQGLARAVGDFVLEWDAKLEQLDRALLSDLLDATDEGAELVEVLPLRLRLSTRIFYTLASWLRPGAQPMRFVVARMMSRRVLSDVLFSSLAAAGFYRVVLFSQDHLPRAEVIADIDVAARRRFVERVGEAVDVLIMGTRVASRLPALFAGFFAMTGVGATLWAILFYLRGDTPEGWTTILAFLGLASAGIFVVLALLSGQIRIAARTETRSSWTTIDVYGSMLFDSPQQPGDNRLSSDPNAPGTDG